MVPAGFAKNPSSLIELSVGLPLASTLFVVVFDVVDDVSILFIVEVSTDRLNGVVLRHLEVNEPLGLKRKT